MGVSLHARRSGSLCRIAFCVCLLLAEILVSISARAQIENYVPVVPGPLKLELRFADGRTQFHMGEVIRVELAFTSPEHRSYSAGEDCTPRQTYEFHDQPQNFTYRTTEIDAALMMHFGNCHGFHQEVDPGTTPFVVNLVLNNWFRMDTAGKYKISVTTARLGFAITSDTVDLEILPNDPAWEDSELQRGLAMVDAPRASGSASWEQGCLILRYLENGSRRSGNGAARSRPGALLFRLRPRQRQAPGPCPRRAGEGLERPTDGDRLELHPQHGISFPLQPASGVVSRTGSDAEVKLSGSDQRALVSPRSTGRPKRLAMRACW